MAPTVGEVCEFVRENDIKFIRLIFCDLFGQSKNISIVDSRLKDAFVNGVSFDAHSIAGFTDITNSDLFLYPDITTLAVLPWRPGQGRVARFYCNIKYPDGTPFERDVRALLLNSSNKLEKLGFECKIGAECEFYLFKTDETGTPIKIAYDNGGYLDTEPLDKASDVRREICLALEEMGLSPEASHHEQGPGQNEVDFTFAGALNTADNMQTFKAVVKAVAFRNGLFASFMPKPVSDAPGNGMHINISLYKNGNNILTNIGEGAQTDAQSFIAGVLDKATEITAFTNPITNSYERLGSFSAPKYVSWSHENRSQLIRIPAANTADTARMELRLADPSANPYLAYAMVLEAGLYGIENKLKLNKPVCADLLTQNASADKKLAKLPTSLSEAVNLAQNSAFVKSVLDKELINRYMAAKQAECAAYDEFNNKFKNKEDFYYSRYFKVI